jgi:signal transduction histidine kinase
VPSPLRTISGRIVLGYAVLVLTFGSLSGFTILRMHQLDRDLRFVLGAYYQVSLRVAQLRTTEDQVVYELNTPDVVAQHAFIKASIEWRRKALTDNLDALGALDVPPGQRASVDAIIVRTHHLLDRLDHLYDDDSKLKEHEGRFQQEIINWQLDLRSATDRITYLLEDAEERTRLGVLTLGALAILVGLAVTLWGVYTLRPLARLRDGVRQIARGDYQKRVSISGGTEVSDLAGEVNAMAAAIEARQRDLVRSERLAAVGKIAAVITHEVRNPLSSIGLNTELLEEELAAESDEAKALCRAIHGEVDRLTAITEEYLRFARLPRPKLEREHVNGIVNDVVEFQREDLALRGVKVEARLAEDLPTIAADEAQLRQALLNLIRNAADAMTGGGTLTLATARTEEGVDIRVADTGAGIAPDALAKIFEPFFSTKEGGTGLGLALTQQIVAEHGGKILVESQPGRGTTFTVRLPISA